MIISACDWSDIRSIIPEAVSCSKSHRNFGIHEYNSSLWTGGYVGINRLTAPNGKNISRNGEELILRVTPRFSVDPWKMLNAVINDEEYYLYSSVKEKGPLFEIFTDSQPIEGDMSDSGGEILLAVSYIKECERICRKQLKTQMSFRDENLHGKIKGKILFGRHIRNNVVNGREDRIYCRFSVFSIDTPENRILKAGLAKAEKILLKSGVFLSNLRPIIRYCRKSLENVRQIQLSSQLFSSAKITGMYAYYKQAIRLADLIYKHRSVSIMENSDRKVQVIPFVINMERLFEYYVRVLIKEQIKSDNSYSLEKFGQKYALLRNNNEKSYLIKNCIPDIVILKNSAPIAVFDAKYKDFRRGDRDDSHQLMSYSLLLDIERCGYIFPQQHGEKAASGKIFEGIINSARSIQIKYEEYIIGCK